MKDKINSILNDVEKSISNTIKTKSEPIITICRNAIMEILQIVEPIVNKLTEETNQQKKQIDLLQTKLQDLKNLTYLEPVRIPGITSCRSNCVAQRK